MAAVSLSVESWVRQGGVCTPGAAGAPRADGGRMVAGRASPASPVASGVPATGEAGRGAVHADGETESESLAARRGLSCPADAQGTAVSPRRSAGVSGPATTTTTIGSLAMSADLRPSLSLGRAARITIPPAASGRLAAGNVGECRSRRGRRTPPDRGRLKQQQSTQLRASERRQPSCAHRTLENATARPCRTAAATMTATRNERSALLPGPSPSAFQAVHDASRAAPTGICQTAASSVAAQSTRSGALSSPTSATSGSTAV